jgi:hypothetical protein
MTSGLGPAALNPAVTGATRHGRTNPPPSRACDGIRGKSKAEKGGEWAATSVSAVPFCPAGCWRGRSTCRHCCVSKRPGEEVKWFRLL